jgi:PqqD family protein of HPr-rel-A system
VRRVLIDDTHWQAAEGLVWTLYDDSTDRVVFHPQSGDVHLVSSSAHLLWSLIADHSAPTLAQLTELLAAALARPVDDELAAATRETVAFMDRTGLVRPVSP